MNRYFVYTFINSDVHISVKALDLVDAIRRLSLVFGERWLKFNFSDFDILRSEHKSI